ncbi:monocarboxylate transporter 6-like isoform X1 [Anneissia japonica]|uniref:monocarboxylate transporter 6-like isoform X1 n=1 Tax=Anneissia japonica TaxID=1529436 RepID=UPI001425BB94|nr:monocarboxylate transporter 6-like isoform X1 [Anneissia japonica]
MLNRMGVKLRKGCVLIGMHVIALLSIGCAIPCFSFFLIQFKEEFGVGSGLIGTANSLCIGLTSIVAPVATIMNRLYGYRVTIMVGALSYSVGLILSSYVTEVWQIFFTHSLLTGGGVCITFQTMVFFVGMNFKKSMNLGNGILFSAIGLGMLVIPLICSVLDHHFGWKAAIRIIGALCLHSVVISALIFRKSFNPYMQKPTAVELPEKYDNEEEEDFDDPSTPMSNSEKDSTDKRKEESGDEDIEEKDDKKDKPQELVIVNPRPPNKFSCLPLLRSLLIFKKYPRLLVMTVSLCFICVGYSGFFVHMIASSKYRGATDFESAVIFGVFGIGNLVGRLANAIPLYFKLISETNLFIISIFVVTVCMAIFGICQTFSTMLFIASVIGLFFGMYIPQIPSIIRMIVPKDKFDKAYGLCIVPSGVTSIFGGYIAGAIYDRTGAYTLSFFFAAGNYGIVTTILVLTEIAMKCRCKPERTRLSSSDDSDVNAPVTAV